MKYHFKLLLSAGILAASMGIQTVQAAKTSITIALQLEPPHLDPTSAAAGAIDSVLSVSYTHLTLPTKRIV